MPSAPAITAVSLQPNVVATDEPVTVVVTWTGDPLIGVSYQWRQGVAFIPGQRAATYVPNGTEVSLNCLVQINNGYGTATAVAIIDTVETPETPADDEGDFSSDFSSDFA